jgi:hypothetical protein
MAKGQATWARVIVPPVITAVVTLGVAVYVAHHQSAASTLLFPNPTPTATVTATATTTATATATTTVTVTESVGTGEQTPVPAGTTYLADMTPVVSGGLSFSPRSVEKKPYAKAVSKTIGCGQPASNEWVLPDQVDRFQAWIGLDDKSPVADARVQFAVVVDGKPVIAGKTLGLKQTERIDVSVRGGLRLRLSVISVAGGNCPNTIAVWGDATITTATP